jgi:upstream activation factor subunit UAF30
MAAVTDVQLKQTIEKLVPRVDIESTGLKAFMKLLSAELGGVDLKVRKMFIRETVADAITRMSQDIEDEGDARDDSEDDAGSDKESVEAPTTTKKKRTIKNSDGSGGGGLAERKEISPQLSAFFGKGNKMARTEIVKSLWEYVREHDLQNPLNRREIILDEAMKNVFACDTFTIFSMNKYISAHIHPFKPVDLTASTEPAKKRKVTPTKTANKKRKTGTQPPYRLSDDLVAVVGKPILPRPQVVSAIWEYIKANDLQNPIDKREILCDAKLEVVMKRKKVSMFKMNQLISPHLIEKVDRSEYQHGDYDEESEEE